VRGCVCTVFVFVVCVLCLFVCVSAVCVWACVCVLCLCVHVCVYCVCVCVCVYICMYVCIVFPHIKALAFISYNRFENKLKSLVTPCSSCC